jgi:predicted phage terminase large subunit-like protein
VAEVNLTALLSNRLLAHSRQKNAVQMELQEWAAWLFPHYFYLDPSELHLKLSRTLDHAAANRGQQVVLVAPRDSAKSTYLTFAQPLRDICEEREKYIMLAADTEVQAKKYLAAVAAELETNELLAEIYPQACGKGTEWNKESIKTVNGIRVEAISTGMRMRGRKEREDRPTTIYIDDPEGDEASHSPVTRERVWAWLHKSVLKAGRRGHTNYIIAGTRVHRDCTVGRLSITPGWTKIEYNSLQVWPTNMQLWAKWKELYVNVEKKGAEEEAAAYYSANKKRMHTGCKVLWPDRESLYDLMCMWAEDPASFQSEKQNNPMDPTKCEWTDEYFDYEGFWFEQWPAKENFSVVSMALDPSKGKDAKRGDYSAVAKIGRTKDGVLYSEVWMQRIPTDVIVSQATELAFIHKPDIFGVEINQFQELLKPDLLQEADNRGILVPYIDIDNRVKKPIRIRRLGPYLAQHKFRFRATPQTRMCIDQMRDVPNGDHDDGPDALEMALRCAIWAFNGKVGAKDGLGSTLRIGG